jgi:hypothetical protein
MDFSYYYQVLPSLPRAAILKEFLAYLEKDRISENNLLARKVFLEFLIIATVENISFDPKTINYLMGKWGSIFPKLQKTRFYNMGISNTPYLTEHEELAVNNLLLQTDGKLNALIQDLRRQINRAEYSNIIFNRQQPLVSGPIVTSTSVHEFVLPIFPLRVKFRK